MTIDERLDAIDAKFDTFDVKLDAVTDVVNALAVRQRPSVLMRFFSQTPVIVMVVTGAITGAVTTIRLVDSVLGQAEQLAVARTTVIPNAWLNFEALAAAADQLCVEAGKPHGASCQRTRLKPPEILQSGTGSYGVALPLLQRGIP